MSPIILLFYIACAIALILLIRGIIYNNLPHNICKNPSALRLDAHIQDFSQELVGVHLASAYRTTVCFSDGFTYISHRSKKRVTPHFRSLHIHFSADNTLLLDILRQALKAHGEALIKHRGKLFLSLSDERIRAACCSEEALSQAIQDLASIDARKEAVAAQEARAAKIRDLQSEVDYYKYYLSLDKTNPTYLHQAASQKMSPADYTSFCHKKVASIQAEIYALQTADLP